MYTASDDTPVSVAINADTNTTDNVFEFKVNYEETEGLLYLPVLRDDHQQHSTNNATAVSCSLWPLGLSSFQEGIQNYIGLWGGLGF